MLSAKPATPLGATFVSTNVLPANRCVVSFSLRQIIFDVTTPDACELHPPHPCTMLEETSRFPQRNVWSWFNNGKCFLSKNVTTRKSINPLKKMRNAEKGYFCLTFGSALSRAYILDYIGMFYAVLGARKRSTSSPKSSWNTRALSINHSSNQEWKDMKIY